ncbi:18538_t:CDS:2 [Racocetra fulgida]|uniref:18538_t:CDS:1 n=1 Tax=Racocetra fulgida TaxID=60492 RepID=A0A9N8W516_9GLOM|nr:18538_t:CDS:2 [Racocetra fulgida]
MADPNNITKENLTDECSDETIILNVGGIKLVSVTPKEIEIELDFFQIPRPTSIDKIAITKIRKLINAFNELISKVVESYLKESSFKIDIDVLFLSNGQATVHALLEENLSDVFLSTKRYAYNIMTLYKEIIKERLENEYPELTWVGYFIYTSIIIFFE